MLADLFNKHMLMRRGTMVWMMWLTTYVILWATGFATTSLRPGAEIAMMIGALLAPIATLQGFVFKFYNEARIDGEKVD